MTTMYDQGYKDGLNCYVKCCNPNPDHVTRLYHSNKEYRDGFDQAKIDSFNTDMRNMMVEENNDK